MATTTTYHAQLIKYDSSGNQSILNLKNTGDDVSISRNSNGNLPSTVTSAQTLANAFGSLAFKSAVAWADVKGLASTELTVSSEGKLADARAIKALNDKIATNTSNIAQLNSNLQNSTILASDWQNDTAPFTATKEVPDIKEGDIIDIVFQCKTTDANKALSNASITYSTISSNAITLYAYGTKPTVDLDVVFIKRGVL